MSYAQLYAAFIISVSDFCVPNDSFGTDRLGFVPFACDPFSHVSVQESELNGASKVSLALN